jgi:prepilin peptidase CpaA
VGLYELALGFTLGTAAWTDWRKRKIYNKLLGPAFLIAFSLQATQSGWSGVWLSLTGSIVGLALLLIPYLMGGIGAGDVKLLGVIGAFGGVAFVITSFLYGAVLGGLVSMFLLTRRHALTAALKRLFLLLPKNLQLYFLPRLKNSMSLSAEQRAACEEKFPYGLVLIAGTIMAYFWPLRW